MIAQFAIIGLGAAILIFLVTRAFWLWYFKVDRALKALDAIEANTADMLEELRGFRHERAANRTGATSRAA